MTLDWIMGRRGPIGPPAAEHYERLSQKNQSPSPIP